MELELSSAVSETPKPSASFWGPGWKELRTWRAVSPCGQKGQGGKKQCRPMVMTGMGEVPGLHLLSAVPPQGFWRELVVLERFSTLNGSVVLFGLRGYGQNTALISPCEM